MKGFGRIKKIARIIKRKFTPAAVILVYHRITDLPVDPYDIAISPSHFAQHLSYINEACSPMRLIDLVEALDQKSLPKRAVVVTFDDGYIDNLTEALPLLKMAQVPATVFATGSKINDSREFWWDDIERVFLSTKELPDLLSLYIHGSNNQWKVTNTEERQLAFKSVHSLVRLLSTTERDKVIIDLIRWAGLELNGRQDYLPLKTDELKQLASDKMVDIGAHTMTHPVLSSIPVIDQITEISESRKRLESILGIPIRTFAYPYGNPSDYTSETIRAVQAAGFSAAVTTIQGSVVVGDDVFQLHRYLVSNWDKDHFIRNLNSYFSS